MAVTTWISGQLAEVTAALTERLGRVPSVAQLAQATGLDLEQMTEALQAGAGWETPRLAPPIFEHEREILRLRLACDMTQTEIAEQLGASQPQIARSLRHGASRSLEHQRRRSTSRPETIEARIR